MIHDMFDLIGLPICNTGLLLYTPSKNNAQFKAKSYSKSTKPVLKATIRWNEKHLRIRSRIRQKNRSHVRSDHNELEKYNRWGNGQNWSHSKSREGNWVRVFPLITNESNNVKLTKLASSNHQMYSTDEIKTVVSSATSFLKIAKDIYAANPNLDSERLSTFMAPYLQSNANIWLPPA